MVVGRHLRVTTHRRTISRAHLGVTSHRLSSAKEKEPRSAGLFLCA